MAALLNPPGLSLSDYSLYVQVLVLVALTVGVLLVKRRMVKQHAWVMLALFVVHAASVLAVMIPVSIVLFSRFAWSWFLYVAGLHAVLGLVVFAYGLYFFYSWGFKTPSPACFRNKPMMRGVAALWVLEILVGIVVYWALYRG